jgi:hypothetical protein
MACRGGWGFRCGQPIKRDANYRDGKYSSIVSGSQRSASQDQAADKVLTFAAQKTSGAVLSPRRLTQGSPPGFGTVGGRGYSFDAGWCIERNATIGMACREGRGFEWGSESRRMQGFGSRWQVEGRVPMRDGALRGTRTVGSDGTSARDAASVQHKSRGRNEIASLHRFGLTNCPGQTQRPHNDLLFREPNIKAA